MISCLLQHPNGHGIEIIREPHIPNWQAWRFPEYPHKLFAGVCYYAALVFTIEVKPNILETDPGPLDARVA